MEKNLNLSDRLQMLIDHYGLSVNELAKKLGGARMKYYNLLKGTSKPDFDTTENILKNFPEISAEWFMRGQGPMLKQEIISREEFDGIKAENNALQVMYEKAVISKAASLGKSEGAILCPDVTRGIRKRMTADSMKLPRARRTSRLISVRVPGTAIPNIMHQVREILG